MKLECGLRKSHDIDTTAMSMATKLGMVMTSFKRLLAMKSLDPLIGGPARQCDKLKRLHLH